MWHRVSVVRVGATLVVALPMLACNTILGVEDVARGCYFQPEYDKIQADATSKLSRTGSQKPTLKINLDPTLPPDASKLYAVFSTTFVNEQQTTITGNDAGPTCGICAELLVSFMTPTRTISQELWAYDGTQNVTNSDTNRLVGSFHELRFLEVYDDNSDMASLTGPIPGGCSVTIHDVEFDMQYTSP
jgi:hypothetical protein